ncbi:MAG: mechanosensitive ion channel family protein [Rhodospirillales bacterium]|jgi:miniconductance mechanosensitive channel
MSEKKITNVESLRDKVQEFLLSWLEPHISGISNIVFDGLVVLAIALFAVGLHYFLHGFLRNLLVHLADKRGQRWLDVLLTGNVFRRLSYVLQGFVVHIQAGLWLDGSHFLLRLIEAAANQWILLFGLLAFFALLDAFENAISQRVNRIQFPLHGMIQSIKLIASILIVLLATSILMGKSPLILLSGFGALSAVLLLVFKDPILGLVAGIQLSANQMLSVGDWLEMPKYGADGDVISIALTTVKVQNWDKTITTIPTYALISDSFKNWRGMTDAGGRRIKRSVLLETNSIRFLDEEVLQRLKQAELLGSYLEERIKTIKHENKEAKSEMSIRLNGRRLTNVGTFRAYLVSYLKAHPKIHENLTLIVRQLEPSAEGLPVQIYAFTNTTDWVEYENIQSDIFDHIFAILPEFELRAHEAPTGHDVRALVGKTE